MGHSSWASLAERLSQQKVSPDEYAYWLVFVNPPPPNAPSNYDNYVLAKRNIVCSTTLLNDFLGWRMRHVREAQHIAASQVAYLKGRLALGTPLDQMLLDTNEDIGPLLRCEAALKMLPANHPVRAEVLTQYSELIDLLLRGVPTYQNIFPQITAIWRKKSHGKQ
jgi:hypothetical protein